MNQDKRPAKQVKPRKKKRRLKKNVRRGCLVFVAAVLLMIFFGFYEAMRPREEADVPEVGIPILPPDATDSLVAETAWRKILTSPCIDTSKLAISIFDIDRHCSVLEHHSQKLMAPASCMKLLTAITAYQQLGISHEYVSRLFADGPVEDGMLHGDLIVQLDDDPEILSFEEFAAALTRQGITGIDGRVRYDLSRRDTLRQHPTASPWDIPYSRVPLLMKGEKRVKKEFAAALPFAVPADDSAEPFATSAGQAAVLHTVTHPMRAVIAPMLIFSSNVKAECIYYHLHHHAAAGQLPPIQRFLLEEMAVTDYERYTINDGSGLSPENRLTTDLLVRLMDYAYHNDSIRQVLIDESLATPGHPERHGSLMGRMTDQRFLGRIFCKTGTLTTIGTSSLTGYAQNADGRWFAFSIITCDTPVADARNMQDAVCGALVR